MTTHRLCELTSLFMPDIAWRRPDKSRHRMRLHILAHIEANIGMGIIPQNRAERFSGLGFSNARRSEEEK